MRDNKVIVFVCNTIAVGFFMLVCLSMSRDYIFLGFFSFIAALASWVIGWAHADDARREPDFF